MHKIRPKSMDNLRSYKIPIFFLLRPWSEGVRRVTLNATLASLANVTIISQF